MQVGDDASRTYPPDGPCWSDEEGAELLRDLHAAFDGLETPPPDRLVQVLPNHSDDTAQIVQICAGRAWHELVPADLMQLFDFQYFVSDEGFPVVVAALLHQAVLAPRTPGDHRLELESRLATLLDPAELAASSDEFTAELIRRIRAFSPAQQRVLRRFMELSQRLNTNPPWAESEGGRFWASLPVD